MSQNEMKVEGETLPYQIGDEHLPSEKEKAKQTYVKRTQTTLDWLHKAFDATTLNEWGRYLVIAACFSSLFSFFLSRKFVKIYLENSFSAFWCCLSGI